MRKLARMVRNHWPNIATYFRFRITNAASESINSKVQRIKANARGFRNRKRFRDAIYFCLGELDLYPERLRLNQ